MNRHMRFVFALIKAGLRGALAVADILSVFKGWIALPLTLAFVDEQIRRPLAKLVNAVLEVLGLGFELPVWAPLAYLSCVMTVVTIVAILSYSRRLVSIRDTIATYIPFGLQTITYFAMFVLAPITIMVLILLSLADARRLVTILGGLALSLALGLLALLMFGMILGEFDGLF